MTEQEAAEKACPWFVAPKCLARGCMAWLPMLDAVAGMNLGPIPNKTDANGTSPITKEDGGCVRIWEAANGRRKP